MGKGLAYPLRTPRTRLSMKKLPTTIKGMKKTQLKALPIASFVWKLTKERQHDYGVTA